MLKYNHIKYDSSDEIRHITKFVPVIFLLIIALNSLAKFKIMRILAPAPRIYRKLIEFKQVRSSGKHKSELLTDQIGLDHTHIHYEV